MSPGQFAAALAEIGWSQRHLAMLLRCDTNLPTRWANGRAAVPKPIAEWLSDLARYHERHPVPVWRVRVVSSVVAPVSSSSEPIPLA